MTPSGLKTWAEQILETIMNFRKAVKESDLLNSQEYIEFEDSLNKLSTLSPDE